MRRFKVRGCAGHSSRAVRRPRGFHRSVVVRAPARPLRTSSFVSCPPARLPGGRAGDVARAGPVVTVERYRARRNSCARRAHELPARGRSAVTDEPPLALFPLGPGSHEVRGAPSGRLPRALALCSGECRPLEKADIGSARDVTATSPLKRSIHRRERRRIDCRLEATVYMRRFKVRDLRLFVRSWILRAIPACTPTRNRLSFRHYALERLLARP